MANQQQKGESGEELNSVNRAAVLLMALGESEAAEVLKHMGPKEVQQVGKAMARMENVQRHDVETVLKRFLSDAREHTALGIGADSYVRNMLTQALGEDKAAALADRMMMGGSTTGLDSLKWMDARNVADAIRHEHPQIQAIVVAYLEPDQSAEVMGYLDERARLDVMMRISSLESIQPAALQELNDILERQLSDQASQSSANMGGTRRAAEIMNYLDTTAESQLLESLKETDEELAEEIEDLMFVFDNLADVDNTAIQALLRNINSEELKTALKGADEAVKEKVFANMSKRAAELLRDDLEAMGPVRVSDVEAAQKEILSVARRMADSGEIVLGGRGGEEMI